MNFYKILLNVFDLFRGYQNSFIAGNEQINKINQ